MVRIQHDITSRRKALSFSCQILLILQLGTVISSCQIDVGSSKLQFPRISTERKLGSACGPGDSASIKRAPFHPLGPTGGWYENAKTLVDYSRTIKRDSNYLTLRDGRICGYVKFDTAGYLQARSYDDYFGDVYCGWAPIKLPLKPTKDPVYVSLSLCAVGDGGLDQIHEVAWFPIRSKTGVLVFSTAHPNAGPPVSTIDLFRKELLGNEYQFNESLAREVIVDYLRDGKFSEARTTIADSIAILSSLKGAVDFSTQQPISALVLHRGNWVEMLLFKLGLATGEPEFESLSKKLEEMLDHPDKSHGSSDNVVGPMLPLYGWLNDRLNGKRSEVPLSSGPPKVVGHDPAVIARYMHDEMAEGDFIRRSWFSAEFWVGVRKYLNGEPKLAQTHLKKFLNDSHSVWYPFEVATAAKLLKRCEHQP